MKLGFHGLLIVLILVVTPLASYFTVFKPMNTRIQNERQEADHKESLLTKLREETSRNADLERANEELNNTIKLIEARLPSNKEVDAVVRQVSDLAVASGLEPPAMKSGKPVPAALYMEQPLELEVTGYFLNFFTFMAQLEKLPRIMRVHDIKITEQMKTDRQDANAPTQRAADGLIKAEFTLSIYFQEDTKVALGEGKP